MFKMIFNISVLAFFSLDLYGTTCDSFTATVNDSYSYCSPTIVADANADVKKLKTIYDCILKDSKAIASTTATNYSEVIGQAVVLENECAHYAATLNTDVVSLNSTTQSVSCTRDPKGTLPGGRATQLAADAGPITAVGIIQADAKIIATGTYSLGQAASPKDPTTDYPAEVLKWEDNTKTLAKDSLLSDLAIVQTDQTKVDAKLKGDYTNETKTTDFKTQLSNSKYDLPPTIGVDAEKPLLGATGATGSTANTGTTANTGATGATGASATTGTSLADQAAIQLLLTKLEDAERNANANNNNYSVAAPVSNTNNPTKSDSGGSSGSGLGAFSGMGGRNGMDDDERKERIARAKEREKDLMHQSLDKSLYGTNTKALKGAPMGSTSSGRLSDLFSSKRSDDTPVEKKKGATPSFFGSEGDSDKQGDEKYKAYFKSGTLPQGFSSKELALNRFSSMYEAARMKAFTEDAYQEFAGRYIDLFLLVHTVLDHEYRDKGKLMDVSETVPSPLGPASPKKRI